MRSTTVVLLDPSGKGGSVTFRLTAMEGIVHFLVPHLVLIFIPIHSMFGGSSSHHSIYLCNSNIDLEKTTGAICVLLGERYNQIVTW